MKKIDKTKIKEFILNLCPEEYKLIFEGISFAQIHYINLLEEMQYFNKNLTLKDYTRVKKQLDKINLLIQKFKKNERNKTSSKI
jgi:hypothetical protein